MCDALPDETAIRVNKKEPGLRGGTDENRSKTETH